MSKESQPDLESAASESPVLQLYRCDANTLHPLQHASPRPPCSALVLSGCPLVKCVIIRPTAHDTVYRDFSYICRRRLRDYVDAPTEVAAHLRRRLLPLWLLPLCLLQHDLPTILSILALIPSAMGQGFQFPGTFIAILAASEQSEQAVVTGTLLLWRSMGMVLGITTSSLIVQNALVHYLNAFVHGDRRDEVIRRVRASVTAVSTLQAPYQEQAIRSYESALRLTFVCCAFVAVVSLLLLIPVKLPRLGSRKA
ncbi:Multidrug resistance protein fnx1 [Tolypocladium paradoxum]|uniref:Multidrug resistance protein fnx1 n=1 Tax=Tolypocladium paradoxum TaxID=94208 RepID=A0A2S4KTV0_9HYPO|nr:Multidrug resistance protein fnx1 [Tolypocladium paradoxum]